MTAQAIGLHFHKDGTLALPDVRNDLSELRVHLLDVVAVQGVAGNAVGRAPLADVGHVDGVLHVHGDGVLVIFAHKDHRQLQNGGHVQGLMEGALVGGAVAEEADHHVGPLLILQGERRAHGDGDASADDPIGAQHTDGEVGDVHGTALALAVAVLAGHQLRKHPLQVRALGDAVAVAAVSGGDVVMVGQVGAYAHCDGLLTVVGVDCCAGQIHLGQLDGLVLKRADAVHLPVEVQ